MTPEDRDLLLALRRQHEELRQALDAINARLGDLEQRAGVESLPELPPIPPEAWLPPIPLPPPVEEIPAALHLPPIPPPPPVLPPVPAGPSFEYQFGRWLVRIGALCGVVMLALLLALPQVQGALGHAGLLGISALAGLGLVIAGDRIGRRPGASLYLGRALMAMALAWLYTTAYAACFDPHLQVIRDPLLAGMLLFAWSIYVLHLAERKRSHFLATFSITLAYISTALNPIGAFTMGADLLLAATAAVFLLRNGWTTLSTFALIGTYFALLRRLVVDEDGSIVLDTSRVIHFWPHAVYLVLAWLIFTVAAILANAPDFRGYKRRLFISANNFSLAGLMALAAYITGYGWSAVGWTMIDTGVVFLFTSRFAELAEIDPVDVMGAYAAQGVALVTAGLMLVYTGITRAVILLVETLLLGIAAAFSGDRILAVTTYVTATFATLFLIWEMAVNAHHPWLFGFGGALVMLINAWACRGEVRNSPHARSTIVISTSCFCIMAIGLIFTALTVGVGDNALPPALALAALVLTFAIYHVALYELPPLAQILQVAALALILFPAETGEEIPWHSRAWVGAITLILITWWARQRVTRSGSWTIVMSFVYALALADMAHLEVRPYLDAQGWIIGASFLSFAFLVYGAFTRVWTLAAVGQIFLALALFHFFFPPNPDTFPWTWLTAAVPLVVVLATARAAHEWVRLFRELPETWRRTITVLAQGYQLVALAAVIRWVFGLIPAVEQVAAFLFLGTLVLSTSVRHPSPFGVRCSFILSVVGMLLYLESLPEEARALATFLNGFAMLLLLAQTGLLRHEGRYLVTKIETGTHIALAALTAWVFVSEWVWTRMNHASLTMGWAGYALFLFLFGLVVREKRLQWCGMAVMVAAFGRVAFHDIWSLSGGYRVLTLLLLSVIAFAVGFVLLRRSGQRPSV